jgi:putative tricarboxylic transport membrane protein
MKKDTIVAAIWLIASIILYVTLDHIEEQRAATFPMVVIVGIGVLSALLLIQSLWVGSLAEKSEQKYPWGRFALLFVMMVAYLATMETVGFYLSSFLFFVAVCFILGRSELTMRRGAIWAAGSAGFTAVLFMLFKVLLEVQTPRGLFY